MRQDLQDFEIKETFEQLANYKKEILKTKVKNACKKYSLDTLVGEIKSKGSENNYPKLETQYYLLSDKINADQARLLFKIKSSMIRVKVNYKNMYNKDESNLLCSVCDLETETLEHAVSKCSKLPIRMMTPYEDLHCEDENKWVPALQDFDKVWRKREELIEAQKIIPVDLESCPPIELLNSEPLTQIVSCFSIGNK